LKKILDKFNPDIVGITAYTVNVNTVKRLFKEIKTWNPEVFTVIGGHHATVSPEDFINPYIDLIVMGEGFFPSEILLIVLKEKKGLMGFVE